MKEIIYYKNSKKYRKIGKDEIIKEGAMHNLFKGGELKSIKGFDTIGDKPSSFSKDREFFNPIEN